MAFKYMRLIRVCLDTVYFVKIKKFILKVL